MRAVSAVLVLALGGCAWHPTPVGMEVYLEGSHGWGRSVGRELGSFRSTSRRYTRDEEVRVGVSVYFDLTGGAAQRRSPQDQDWEWVDCEPGDQDPACR